MKPASSVLLALTLLACAAAQNMPSVTAQPNTVYVSAEGKFESAPDTALIQFNISAQENSARAAYDRAAQESEQVRQILRSNGVDPKSAEIGFFSLQPVYDWKDPKRRVIGFRVSNSVSLKLKDFAKVGPIVQQLGAEEFNENVNLGYTLQDIDAAKLRAVEDAFQRARAEAAAAAKAGDRALGELSYASVDTFEPIIRSMGVAMQARAMAGQAQQVAAPTEVFSAQKITVTARVSAAFALK
ncbi:MAG: SIMPL domain-containing protein [Acidobacteriia bacterium]|nr:SIMPL domain-containing protein [Terriglobia bacterium]